MRALITGASGTIGTVLCNILKAHDWEVYTWNRSSIPVDDYDEMENYLKSIHPDMLFHLAYTSDPDLSWKVNYEWTSELAWLAKILDIRFLFTSTNLVFKNSFSPIGLQSQPDAESGYGFVKRKAEERILIQNQDAVIVRLGWQIGTSAGSNNMVDYFENKMKNDGVIRASTKWFPACSFLQDTCEKLMEIAKDFPRSTYMLDSNKRWNMHEIAAGLKRKFDFDWKIQSVEDFDFDSRMIDDRVRMASLDKRIPL